VAWVTNARQGKTLGPSVLHVRQDQLHTTSPGNAGSHSCITQGTPSGAVAEAPQRLVRVGLDKPGTVTPQA